MVGDVIFDGFSEEKNHVPSLPKSSSHTKREDRCLDPRKAKIASGGGSED